jgi:excisionase family DNA binding protein
LEYLTPEETARYLRISLSSVYKKAGRNELPSVKIGRALRFPRDELDRWLKARMRRPRSKEAISGDEEPSESTAEALGEFFGLWKDRKIPDSVEYINKGRDNFFKR